MNASDIVKAKQSQILFKAYNRPTIFQSSIYSTLNTISLYGSTIDGSGNLSGLVSTVGSCINTVYTYVCNPTFVSYEAAQSIKDGAYVCGGKTRSELQWKNTNSTLIYSYKPEYISTGGPPSISTINSFIVTSTTILTGPSPIICPLINFYQGTNFDSQCNVCNNILAGPGACCHNCAS
jgi:hypothetical protein